MDNRNVVTKARIFLSNGEESEVMTEPSYDEIMAAQALLEFSREIRRFYDNINSTKAVGAVNLFLPIPVNRDKFSNYQRLSTYIPMATLQADRINSVGGEVGSKLNFTYPTYSPYAAATHEGSKLNSTYPTYSPYAAPTHEILPMNPVTKYEIPETLPPLLSYIPPYLASSSQGKEENLNFVVVKKEEMVENQNEIEDEKPKISNKRKFYINQVSKKREADIAYHCKKLEVKNKLEQYRYF